MKRRLALIAIALAALSLASLACGGAQETGYQTSAGLSAEETAVAQATRDAYSNEARATSSALDNEARATRQAQEARATEQAAHAQATQQAQASIAQATQQAHAVQATATAEAVAIAQATQSANATATRVAATATMEQAYANAQSTAINATAQAIERQDRIESNRETLTTFGGWVGLALATAMAIWLILQILPVIKARIGAIYRDERGDPPMLALTGAGGMVILDPLRLWGGATTIDGEAVRQPLLTDPQLQDGTTKRAQFVDWRKGGRPAPVIMPPNGGHPAMGPGPEQQGEQWNVEPEWPARVPLSGILRGTSASYKRLALGVTVHDDGQREIVRADMTRMVHVAVGGSSGWGKSVFLQSIAYQLARSTEPVDLALIDLEGVTFGAFSQCSRLLYPVADNERDTLAILQALTGEMNRRKELYGQYPGVADLDQYNAQASERLSPVVAIFDEATALLADGDVENAVSTLVLRARKYGLWVVLGGQDWKASSLSTKIRNQLASRVQFKAMSASQSRVLLQQSGAETLDVPGRALAILPGRDMIKLQSPIVSHNAILELTGGGPMLALPEQSDGDAQGDDAQAIRARRAEGVSLNQIQQEFFGYVGGAAFAAVKAALEG